MRGLHSQQADFDTAVFAASLFRYKFHSRQVSLSAVCVRIGGLGLNFIRRRSSLVRFIRRVSANLAQVLLAFVSLVRVLFAPDAVCV